MKTKSYIVAVILLISFGCSKGKKNDNGQEPTDSLSIYISSAKKENISEKASLHLTRKARHVISDRDNDLESRKGLYDIASQFVKLQQDQEAISTLKDLLEKSLEKKDTLNIAKSYYLRGSHKINIGQNDSAFYFLLKSEKLFLKLKDSIGLGQNYIDKAFVQLYENDYSGCELSSIQALSYFKNHSNPLREYDAYNLIGISSNELKNFDNAIAYHTKALNIVRNNNLRNSLHLEANSLNNIGVVYQNLEKHNDAIVNFRTALREPNLLRDSPSMYAMITDNLAYSKFKLKDYTELPDLFFQSLRIRENNKMASGVIANKIHISEFYAERKDTVNAQKYAYEALLLAKTNKVSGDLLGSLKQLSIVEHKNASQYSREYIKISDSLQQEERKAKDRFARIQYETDEIIGEKDKLAEQNRNLVYFFIGTLLIGLLLFVIRNQRAKNRELLLIQAQQKANEEIYSLMISQQDTIEESRVKEKKRIAQELHDGVLGRLFGARLNLDSLNKFGDEESINSRFNYLNELKNIEQDIREISHDLNREKYVLINNFVAIVNNLLEEQKNSHKPDLVWNIDSSIKWDTVSNTVKINFYRILQESLQNINKYANANKIQIEFKKNDSNIILKISDDGIGFDLSIKKKGIGLQNMFSRVNDCNGTIDVKSKKNKGTIITVILPE